MRHSFPTPLNNLFCNLPSFHKKSSNEKPFRASLNKKIWPRIISILEDDYRKHLVIYKMTCYSMLSLIRQKQQSLLSICILYLVCSLNFVPSQHFAPGLHSAYSICSLSLSHFKRFLYYFSKLSVYVTLYQLF